MLALRANRANEMGDVDVAIELYDRALHRRAREEGRDGADFARLLHNRAEMLARGGRIGAALASRRDAVEIQERVLAADDPDLALGRMNLAGSLLEAGAAAEALPLLDAVEPVLTARLTPDHPALANLLLLRARALAATGDSAAAVDAAENAVLRRRRAYGEEHIEVAWARDAAARHELAAGALDRAAVHARAADRIAREHLRDAVLTLPERQALAFVGAGRAGRSTLIEIARRSGRAEDVDAAFDATVRGRALVLDALLDRERTTATGDTSLATARERLRDARRDLVAAATGGEADATRWRRLRERRERAEAALAAVPVADRGRSARHTRGREHVLAALRPDEALVAFTVLDDFDRAVAFVARSGDVLRFDLGSAAELGAAVDTWLAAMRAPITRFTEDAAALRAEARRAGRALGARIFDPIEESLAGVARVWWVADGNLHRVQPAALVDGEDRWLARRDLVFAHLGAARDLEDVTARAASARVLAVGDPDFGPGTGSADPCPDLASLRFDRLPATRDEVTSLGATTTLLGAEATEARWRDGLAGHDVLHLATHGFFLPTDCARDARAVATRGGLRGIGGVVRRTSAPASAARLGPLLRSGLALAGANARGGDPASDGLLLAEEIAGLDLGSVHTVVLSACDTGVGRIVSGEGVLGLPRAFRRAGAERVVMSLWPVQDEATRAWMRAFYAARGSGADVASAAHAARKELLDSVEFGHPFFWAAFVGIGPGR